MNELAQKFHEVWLGMAQPIEGLVVSVPVLVDAQCMERLPPAVQEQWRQAVADGKDFAFIARELLGYRADDFETTLPEDLRLDVVEGRQTLRATAALKRRTPLMVERGGLPDDSTPASRAGDAYLALVWELRRGLPLDARETETGQWDTTPTVKFDRLLRATRVPIGILSNGETIRLLYAPHGESSGHLTFKLKDVLSVGGRPLLDALVMLLHSRRFFGVSEEHTLPRLLADSRRRQANVTEALATQVFEALGILLAGFEAAGSRDRSSAIDDAMRLGEEHVYGGLLTVLLRLVFLLYAEDRELMPSAEPYAGGLSVNDLYEELQGDAASFPDAMSRRYGAWPRLLALFRCVFEGARHGDLVMPPRRGELFDPERYPFLEGWTGGGAPVDPEARAAVQVPSVDDETIYRVLKRLLVLERQRLSYRALDVEQIGSVYEALMGYHVMRLTGPGVCLKSKVWVSADDVLGETPARRAKWLEEQGALEAKAAKAVAKALAEAEEPDAVLEALEPYRLKSLERAKAGRLVLQPGEERRRTSSHYTPRSLSAPIVRRALEPLLKAMGETPSSERLLNLKICDPAMGSGAFLVEACRFLGDQVVAAWTREGLLDRDSGLEDVTMRARRLVAQRCLYGVDKNPFAVTLAKLSLWLVTLARGEPFTFLDHALKAGDSLVGLSLEQLHAFHWKPQKQLDVTESFTRKALTEALKHRQQILQMALDLEGPHRTAPKQRMLDPVVEKQRLLQLADEALENARAVADACLGAFFSCDSEKAREAERKKRLDVVGRCLAEGTPVPQELRTVRGFHWMLEFPEVFHGKRPDPLDSEQVNKAAWMDAFVGNPPFMGGSQVSSNFGDAYRDWLLALHAASHGNADYSAHFFRRGWHLLGEHGTIGFIATNTIAQGDTRATGLQHLLGEKGIIYDAVRSMKWPVEAANVSVSVVHVAKGHVASLALGPRLDGHDVGVINSRLRGKPERPDPQPLKVNDGKSFLGAKVYGEGFVLTPQQRAELIAKNPRNAERIFRYIGGEEINADPDPALERYVINFGELSLEDAAKWPQLLDIVQRLVKPERERNNREGYRRYWWHFAEKRRDLQVALRPLSHCIVSARTSKHLAFSIRPTGPVYSENAIVLPLGAREFAVLQSRIHLHWVRLTSSTLEDRQGYRPSDCFDTFAFPPEPALTALSAIGDRLDSERKAWMTSQSQGLTTTYNRLKDPHERTEGILKLRALHEELDRAVLAAYGWQDIPVPPYCGASAAELEAFEDEVLDRLFDLNAQRAGAEAKAAEPEAAPKKKRRAKTTTA